MKTVFRIARLYRPCRQTVQLQKRRVGL